MNNYAVNLNNNQQQVTFDRLIRINNQKAKAEWGLLPKLQSLQTATQLLEMKAYEYINEKCKIEVQWPQI